MTEEKKVTGEEFRNRIAAALTQKGSKTAPTPEDEADQYTKKAKAAEAKFQYYSTIDNLNNPPSLQELRQKREQELEEERRRSAQRTQELEQREYDRLQKERQEIDQQLTEEHQRREKAESELRAERDRVLMEKLQELKSSQKPLEQQVEEYFSFAERMAEKMGFQKPDARPAFDDPKVTLEIKKMELDQAREEREFQWKMEQDRREWDVKFEQMKQDREFRKEELAQQAKKDQMFATLPETIGSALAKGLIEHEQGAAGSAPGKTISQPAGKRYKFTANEGDTDTVPCPNCGSPIGIGPTSTIAHCASCDGQFTIDRRPVDKGEQEVPAGDTSQYYEEDR